MLSSDNLYNSDNRIEFLSQRPIGWSSVCLDSTIDYYLNCNYSELQEGEDLVEDSLKENQYL